MKIRRIVSISNILTDSCVIRQKQRIKNAFGDIFYNVLKVEKSCKKITKFV